MKKDYGKFDFNKRDWKITKKEKSYYENFDGIFRKEKGVNKNDKPKE
jgi:hypothetical protein